MSRRFERAIVDRNQCSLRQVTANLVAKSVRDNVRDVLNLYGTIASKGDNSMAGPRGGKEKEERRKKKKGRKKKERGRRKEEGRRKGGGGEGKRRKKGGKKGEKKKKWGALLVHSKKMYL